MKTKTRLGNGQRRAIGTIFLSLMLGLLLLPLRAQAQILKPKIAVVSVNGQDQYRNDVENTIIGEVQTRIIGTQYFTLVERDQLKLLLGEIKLNESGVVSEEDRKKLGETNTVDYLVYATVDNASTYRKTEEELKISGVIVNRAETYNMYKIRITYRVSNVSTGEMVEVTSVEKEAREGLVKAAKDTVSPIVDRLAARFRPNITAVVAAVKSDPRKSDNPPDGEYFIVDGGKKAGLTTFPFFEVCKVETTVLFAGTPKEKKIMSVHPVCKARMIRCDDELAYFEAGHWEERTEGGTFNRKRVWHFIRDGKALAQIAPEMIVRGVPNR